MNKCKNVRNPCRATFWRASAVPSSSSGPVRWLWRDASIVVRRDRDRRTVRTHGQVWRPQSRLDRQGGVSLFLPSSPRVSARTVPILIAPLPAAGIWQLSSCAQNQIIFYGASYSVADLFVECCCIYCRVEVAGAINPSEITARPISRFAPPPPPPLPFLIPCIRFPYVPLDGSLLWVVSCRRCRHSIPPSLPFFCPKLPSLPMGALSLT